MSGYWLDLALVAVLVLVNAVFAGSEMALVTLREGQLKALERDGPGGQRLARLARDPNRFLATIQIGITLAGFLASATAAVALAEPLVPSFEGPFGRAAAPVAIGSVTAVLTFFTLVFGELAPKRLAMQWALPWARAVARPLDVLSTITRPLVLVLGAATNLVVRVLGGKPQAEPEEISPEELRELVVTHRVLNPEQREIITGALELHDRTLSDILVPRASVRWLEPAMTLNEARQALADAGHSRAPVLSREDGERVEGVIHWAAVAAGGHAPVLGVATPALYLPDSLPVDAALRAFKSARAHLAIVLDEHGQIDGIVTLEDVLEEIVGEIYDETDKDILAIERADDGSLLLPGSFPVHDLPDLDVELADPPVGDYSTIAGLLLVELGAIPEAPGQVVGLDARWEAVVEEVAGHAITRVRLRPSNDH